MPARKPEVPRHPIVDPRTGAVSAPWLRYVQDLKNYLDELVNVVVSVFGRAGAVVAATGDYDASQVDNDSQVAGASVKDALNTLRTTTDDLTAKRRWVSKAGAHAATAFERLLCDTSGGGFTVTLSASPAVGDEVWIMDAKGTWNASNLTVSGNGRNVMGGASRTYATANGWAALVYNGTEWRERT